MLRIKDIFNLIKNSKKAKRILWLIALVLFIILFSRFQKTKQMKIYYNKGNEAYKQNDYASAEDYYSYALWEKPSKHKECKVRINKALSIVTPITPESVTYENLDESIERLKYAQDILTENECAHEDDSNGHNKKAQTLKEEIDEYIEYLKENTPPPEDDNGGEGENEKETPDSNNGEDE